MEQNFKTITWYNYNKKVYDSNICPDLANKLAAVLVTSISITEASKKVDPLLICIIYMYHLMWSKKD